MIENKNPIGSYSLNYQFVNLLNKCYLIHRNMDIVYSNDPSMPYLVCHMYS